jgi:hypothetical protein
MDCMRTIQTQLHQFENWGADGIYKEEGCLVRRDAIQLVNVYKHSSETSVKYIILLHVISQKTVFFKYVYLQTRVYKIALGPGTCYGNGKTTNKMRNEDVNISSLYLCHSLKWLHPSLTDCNWPLYLTHAKATIIDVFIASLSLTRRVIFTMCELRTFFTFPFLAEL